MSAKYAVSKIKVAKEKKKGLGRLQNGGGSKKPGKFETQGGHSQRGNRDHLQKAWPISGIDNQPYRDLWIGVGGPFLNYVRKRTPER